MAVTTPQIRTELSSPVCGLRVRVPEDDVSDTLSGYFFVSSSFSTLEGHFQ